MINPTLNRLYLNARRILTNAKPITVIKYHSISNIADPYNISPEALTRQTDFISTHYKVARLSDLNDILADKSFSYQRTVILTFDDAYKDFLEIAYPILVSHKIPCTVFIPTGFIGKTNEWDRHLPTYVERPIMTAEQLLDIMSDGLVDYGSHSKNHKSMSTLSENEMKKEAVESKKTLEDLFNCPITMFCYPFGHFSKITSKVLLDANYEIAVTSKWGALNAERNILNLKIVYLSEDDTPSMIRDKIDGLHDIYYIRGFGYIKGLLSK